MSDSMTATHLINIIGRELKAHASFTIFGTLTGGIVMFALIVGEVPRLLASQQFRIFHPSHVLVNALISTAMFHLYGGKVCYRKPRIGYI